MRIQEPGVTRGVVHACLQPYHGQLNTEHLRRIQLRKTKKNTRLINNVAIMKSFLFAQDLLLRSKVLLAFAMTIECPMFQSGMSRCCTFLGPYTDLQRWDY